MVEAINVSNGLACQVHYRPHPKERLLENMPLHVEMDVSPRWDQAVREFDVFIGLDSMAMVEAHLAGKYCIALGFGEVQALSDNSIPFSFPGILENLADFPSELVKALETVSTGNGKERDMPTFLVDSTERTLDVFDRFALGTLSA